MDVMEEGKINYFTWAPVSLALSPPHPVQNFPCSEIKCTLRVYTSFQRFCRNFKQTLRNCLLSSSLIYCKRGVTLVCRIVMFPSKRESFVVVACAKFSEHLGSAENYFPTFFLISFFLLPCRFWKSHYAWIHLFRCGICCYQPTFWFDIWWHGPKCRVKFGRTTRCDTEECKCPTKNTPNTAHMFARKCCLIWFWSPSGDSINFIAEL